MLNLLDLDYLIFHQTTLMTRANYILKNTLQYVQFLVKPPNTSDVLI